MVLKEFNSPMVLEETADPSLLRADEVLIRVKACGICRTDLKISKGLYNPPVSLPHILGHEFSGIVERVGEGVREVEIGQRAVAYFYLTCGRCRYCRNGEENVCSEMTRPGFELDGGFAEYVKVPASSLVPLSEGISFEEAAVLPDAVAVPYHAISRLGRLQRGESILIVGVGGLGVHAIQIARVLGAQVIASDVDDERLKVALGLGANEVVNARDSDKVEKIRDLTEGYGADLSIDLVGTPMSFNWALEATRKGGRYVLVGYAADQPLQVDTVPYHLYEWRLIGCRGSTKQDLADVVDLTQRGLIKPIIDRVYPLERANEGMQDLEAGKILGRAVLQI